MKLSKKKKLIKVLPKFEKLGSMTILSQSMLDRIKWQ